MVKADNDLRDRTKRFALDIICMLTVLLLILNSEF